MDPHPDGTMLSGNPLWAGFFVKLDPSLWKKYYVWVSFGECIMQIQEGKPRNSVRHAPTISITYSNQPILVKRAVKSYFLGCACTAESLLSIMAYYGIYAIIVQWASDQISADSPDALVVVSTVYQWQFTEALMTWSKIKSQRSHSCWNAMLLKKYSFNRHFILNGGHWFEHKSLYMSWKLCLISPNRRTVTVHSRHFGFDCPGKEDRSKKRGRDPHIKENPQKCFAYLSA